MSKNHLLWPKAPGIPGRCCQAGASEGSQGILQEPVEDEPFLWSVQRWGTPSLQSHAFAPADAEGSGAQVLPSLFIAPRGPVSAERAEPCTLGSADPSEALQTRDPCQASLLFREPFNRPYFRIRFAKFLPRIQGWESVSPLVPALSGASGKSRRELSRCGLSLSLSLFSSAARVLGPGFRAHRSNFRSPISEVIIVFSFPLRWDREGRTWPWNPKVWIPVSAVGHAGCAALDMSLNPFTPVPSLVK